MKSLGTQYLLCYLASFIALPQHFVYIFISLEKELFILHSDFLLQIVAIDESEYGILGVQIECPQGSVDIKEIIFVLFYHIGYLQ